ncbi:unnamed protein product [Clavelina lepadiformis]|uniref:Uncharacterized protein n=1 Tax=Clavelina lepadiformis TaxID=159417 RepID=A0ABP0FYI8_CLALP
MGGQAAIAISYLENRIENRKSKTSDKGQINYYQIFEPVFSAMTGTERVKLKREDAIECNWLNSD